MIEILQAIFDAVLAGDAEQVKKNIQGALENNLDPAGILNEGMIAAMLVVGQRLEAGEYNVPEMLVAARAKHGGMALLKPNLQQKDVKSRGKVVIGTVKGDLYGIGKNLVALMLEGAGFEIRDLGTDVAAEDFIAVLHSENVDLLALSVLLTTTMPSLQQTIEAMKAANLREQLRIMIGGGLVTEAFARQNGADGY